MHQVGDDRIEVAHIHEVLRQVDVGQLVHEEATQERHLQAGLHGNGKLGVVDVGVLEALDGLGRLGEPGAGALQRFDEEGRLLFVDPRLDAGDDFAFAQVAGGDVEGLASQAGDVA